MDRPRNGSSAPRLVVAAFWAGAILDLVAGAQLLFPRLPTADWIPADAAAGPAFGLRTAAVLMLGWTVVLAWGAHDPLARAGLLPITVLVVAGLFALEVHAVVGGAAPIGSLALTWTVQSSLTVLLLAAWRQARRAERA
jgi:hypothetical protein